MALTVVTILGVFYTVLRNMPALIHGYYRYNYYHDEDLNFDEEGWASYYEVISVFLIGLWFMMSVIFCTNLKQLLDLFAVFEVSKLVEKKI